MTYKSFPAGPSEFGPVIAIDQVDSDICVMVGTSNIKAVVISAETALEVAAFLKESAEKILQQTGSK